MPCHTRLVEVSVCNLREISFFHSMLPLRDMKDELLNAFDDGSDILAVIVILWIPKEICR